MKIQLSAVVLIFCLTLQGFAEECVYKEPKKIPSKNLFEKLISRSNKNTFQSMVSALEKMEDSCHQFYFKYPLQNERHARLFAKVMRIKAQEAHRFVPVIDYCHFLEPRHLGFSRRIVVAGMGPIVQEHVCVDQDRVIFIEEYTVTPDGEVHAGAFAALNSIVEENGSWYFSGMYLYPDQPDQQEIEEQKGMFRRTYENMLSFIEKENIEAFYNQLKRF